MAEIWHGARIKQSPAARKQQICRSQGDQLAAPLLLILSANLAAAAGFFLLLYTLYQPQISPNPGGAAYMPPPATRLIPLPRRSDAPELPGLPEDLPSALNALAQAQTRDQNTTPDARPPARKRPRADPGEDDHRKFGLLLQWEFGYRGSNT